MTMPPLTRSQQTSANKASETDDVDPSKSKAPSLRSRNAKSKVNSAKPKQPTIATRSKEPARKTNTADTVPETRSTAKNASRKLRSNVNTTSKTSSALRQTTLQESFSKQEKRALRPRPPKDITDDTKNNKTSLKKKPPESKKDVKTGPVYKTVNVSEQDDDKEKVYDFCYDANDSMERKAKKKKKIVRRAPIKKTKIPAKKQKPYIEVPCIERESQTVAPVPKPKSKPLTKVSSDEAIKKDLNKVETGEEIRDEGGKSAIKKTASCIDKMIRKPITVVAEVYAPPPSPPTNSDTQIGINSMAENDPPDKNPKKGNMTSTNPVHIISDDILENPVALTAFMPRKTMMDHPLLQKSLSPISKEIIDFDVGSPWRPIIPLHTFSRVKNVFQSTPHIKKCPNLLDKPSNVIKNIQGDMKMKKMTENNNENSTVSFVNKSPEKSIGNTLKSPRKFGTEISNINSLLSPSKEPKSPEKNMGISLKSPRKFGTEISNVNLVPSPNKEQRNSSKSPRRFANEIPNAAFLPNKNSAVSERISNKRQPLAIQSLSHENSIEIDVSNQSTIFSTTEASVGEKENSAPNHQSPVKSPGERIGSNITPLTRKPLSDTMNKKSEDIETLPNSSGLHKRDSPTQAKNLKQSNLRSFLNLPEIPEATRISTAHGIFDDVHSTPIPGKLKTVRKELNLENAFGFDDDEDCAQSQLFVSPIKCPDDLLMKKKKMKIDKLKDENSKKPARFSLREVKRKLLATNQNKVDEEVQVDIPAKEGVNPVCNSVSVSDFLDTFDYGTEKTDKENPEEFLLFADLEPVHFRDPPRYSYKRKRSKSLNSSGELGDDLNTSDGQRRGPKKKKVGKVAREQKKKLNDWAKNLNETFDEIEHFDLVVEPIHTQDK